MKVLVTGATGYIGGLLVPELLAAGHNVVCMARDPGKLAGRDWEENVQIRQADAFDPESLEQALSGIDAAYYLIHSMAGARGNFIQRDTQAAENFGRAAAHAGVSRIIYLGGLGSSDEELSAHLASRQQTGEALRASGVPVTEFRAAIVVGAGSVSFEMIRYLTDRLPVMITPKWVSTRCQPIAVENVLDYLVQCLNQPESAGRILEIGGPDILTYGEMMLGYAQVRNLTRRLISVPLLTPRLSSYWVDLVTPIPTSISSPLIEGLRTEVIVRDHTAEKIFALDLIPYQAAVRQAVQRTLADEVTSYWAGAQTGLDPGVTLKTTEGMIIEQRRVSTSASADELYRAFRGIGGTRGWLYADWLWDMRGLGDRLVGGVGMRRGRRHPDDLRPGDALDFWRVEEIKPGSLVRLRAEMKLPGLAWLQFEAVPDPDGSGSQLVQTAFFEPRGILGLAYWYGLYPVHQVIFSRMATAIVRLAEQPTSATPPSIPERLIAIRSASNSAARTVVATAKSLADKTPPQLK